MKLKRILLSILITSSMSSFSQNKIDLSDLKLNENTETLLKGVSDIRKGEMFERADMVSYGITNMGFTYRSYVPKEIELLSYKTKLAGYAFKVLTQIDQEKILSYLKGKYKNLTIVKSNLQTNYNYKDKTIFIEYRTIGKEQFEKGMNAYLSVKRMDFYEAYEKLLSKH